MLDFGNVVTAMVTPFTKDDQVDLKASQKLAQHLEKTGTDCVLLAGTTGESPTLTSQEKIDLLKAVKEAVDIPVMLGTGSNNTAASIELSKKAQAAGADALLLVVPYYNKPNQEGMIAHFTAIAQAVDIPTMLYNIPGRSAINLEADSIIRLAKVPNITALKAASGNLDQITRVRLATDDSFTIYSGDDSMTLPILSIGGKGVVSVASNVIGTPIQEMVQAYHQADLEEARQAFLRLYPFFKAMFVDTNPIPIKYAVHRLGLINLSYRLPMVPPEKASRRVVDDFLSDYGLL